MNFLKLAKTWSGAWRLCTRSDFNKQVETCQNTDRMEHMPQILFFSERRYFYLSLRLPEHFKQFSLNPNFELTLVRNFFDGFSVISQRHSETSPVRYTSHLRNSTKGNSIVLLFCGVLFKQVNKDKNCKRKTKNSHIYPLIDL